MSDKPLAARLQIKPGQRVYAFNWPEGFPENLGQFPTGTRLVDDVEQADVVMLFYSQSSELIDTMPGQLSKVPAVQHVWIAYPKIAARVSDLTRQRVHNAIRINGWKPVAQINVDPTWTAIRARISS